MLPMATSVLPDATALHSTVTLATQLLIFGKMASLTCATVIGASLPLVFGTTSATFEMRNITCWLPTANYVDPDFSALYSTVPLVTQLCSKISSKMASSAQLLLALFYDTSPAQLLLPSKCALEMPFQSQKNTPRCKLQPWQESLDTLLPQHPTQIIPTPLLR